MASLATVAPQDVLGHILEYAIDNNTSDYISYASVSIYFRDIVSIIIRSQIIASRKNPYLKDLYGDLLLGTKNSVLAAYIKYSYDQDRSFEHFGLELIHVLQNVLFSTTATAGLKRKSEEILGRFVNHTNFAAAFEKMTGIVLRNALFPIVYELGTSKLDNMDALMISSKYFNHPPKIIKHLLHSVPQNMEQYLIPYDEKEKKRLLNIAKWGERLHDLFMYGAINFAISLFYFGYLSVHKFNLYAFVALYLVVNNLVYALVKKWSDDIDVTVYFPAANGATDNNEDNDDDETTDNDDESQNTQE